MNASKKSFALTNGWILCPSKSFPGKFYYFNVLNGEAAWSLNEADKKILRKDTGIHKIADKSHNYPEPTTLPDDTSIISTPNIGSNFRKPDFQTNISYTQHLPTFDQASFPKCVANVEPLIPNIVWTPIQLPMPMYCQETKKPMIDEVTQTSEVERELFIQTCDVPLCKRFKNYENPSLSFDKKNKIMNKPTKTNFETSTPMKHSIFDVKPESLVGVPKSKLLIKEPVLKLETKSPISKNPYITKNNANSTLITAYKVENTKAEVVPNVVQEEEVLDNLDRTDLRFLLLAKRRKSVDATADGIFQCKKPRPNDLHTTPKKKVTFDLTVADKDSVTSEENIQEDYIPLTTSTRHLNLDSPKSTSILHLRQEKSAGSGTYREIPRTPLTPKIPLISCARNYTYRELPTSSLSPCPRNDTYLGISISPPCPYADGTNTDTTLDIRIPHGRKENNWSMAAKNDIWYIVVDTDVLLLDYDFIDKLILSDHKCKLLIPHAVRVDIEALCIGDCRGQQRVINARQLTRRLATPPAHYLVEPAPEDDNSIFVTTESILNCCVQAVSENYSVVLITNDPHLQNRAGKLNIPSYKLTDIKNGVDFKPNTSSELIKNKININNEDTNKINLFLQNKTESLLNNHNNNLDLIKKQLFLNNEKPDNIILDCDKLINITKSKCQNNYNKYDSDSTTADISRDVQNLNLKDKNNLKQQKANKNQFSPLNVTNTKNIKCFINFEKKFLNPDAILNGFDFDKVDPNSKLDRCIPKPNFEVNNLQKEIKQNIQNTDKIYRSIPISNIKPIQSNFQNKFHFENVSNPQQKSLENSGKPVATNIPNMCRSLRHDPYGISSETQPTSATQARIKKMFSSINCESTNTKDQFEISNDTTGIFKVPQPLQFKNRTRTSAVVNSSITNDNTMREFKTIDPVEKNLRRFCVKSKIMNEKISTRMDEWICTHTQIMEEVLNDLLQKNSECMKDTMAPLTLHDKLNCTKMLYDSHTNVRDAIDNVSEYLNKCICKKGNKKSSIRPDDFMQMLRHGVLLIHALKAIQPSEELSEAESCLNFLLRNIESNSVEFDPELLKAPSVSRTELGNKDEVRPNFLKEPSYVTNYLKKHFKEWASYNEDPNSHNYSRKSINHTDFKVVRTFGKNLNMLKIDSSKAISLTKMATKVEAVPESKETSKIIRLLENQPILSHKENLNKEIIEKKETEDNKSYLNKEHKMIIDNKQEKEVLKSMKPIQTVDKDPKDETKIIEDLDFPTHGNTFSHNNDISGPKMIRNIKIIDEYERKIYNKESLDLDLLDYSEIYEPSANDYAESLQLDVVCDKNGSILQKNNLNYDNYGLTKAQYTDDFTEDVHLGPGDVFYASEQNNYDTNNKDYTMTTLECDTTNNIITNEENIIDNNNIYEFYDITDNNTIINVNINNNHKKTDCGTDNRPPRNDNCIDNDNCKTHNDNFEKTAQLVRDDSTNDSGFENDSTCAHAVVKIFLKELSTSFKVIFEFVNKFIIDIRSKEQSEMRINNLHIQASKSLEDMVVIIQRLKSIIKRESAEETVLKTLLRKAGVEATTDKRMTRYRQIVVKSLAQAQILENALKIIVSTTIGDFDGLSTNAESFNSSIRYLNIFE